MKRPASIAFGSPPNPCLSGKNPPLSKIAHNLIKNSKASSPLAVIYSLYNLTFKTFIVAMFSPPLAAYLINSVGIRANLKGYSYLKKVIACGVMKPELLHPISKGAYRMASVEFGVNASCIERNIRLAIDSAYYNSPDRLRSIFPYPGGKPYVSEFIAVVVDLIRVELLNSNIELYDEL